MRDPDPVQADRLLSILLSLLTRGPGTRARGCGAAGGVGADRLPDVEALSAAGGAGAGRARAARGIELLAGFRTDVTGLTADEWRALFVWPRRGALRAGAGRGRGAPVHRARPPRVERGRPASVEPVATADADQPHTAARQSGHPGALLLRLFQRLQEQ